MSVAAMPEDGAIGVHLVATEESADALGAALMHALRVRSNGKVRFAGVGGRQMAAEGLQTLFSTEDLAIIGLAAIPRRLPTFLRRIRETARAVIAARPDVLIIIDSPDFTHRIARAVRAVVPSIPIVDYVSPAVWAWRPRRASAMRAYIDHVLALLPFEPDVHRRLGGPPCTYVGHPLIERHAELRPSAADMARREASPPVVLILPGSRASEVRRSIEPFAKAIALVAARVGRIDVVLPTLPHLVERLREATADWPVAPRIVVDAEEKKAAFRVARAALAASGTVTLELALAGVPTVAAYKVPAWEAVIARRVIHVPSVILANLVLDENVVPEFLQEDCTPERLAAALAPLLSDGPERRRQIEAFARLDGIMDIGKTAPSERAADIVLGMVRTFSANGRAAAAS